MASLGPYNPALGESDSTVGAVAWSTPTNIGSSNNARATAVLNNQQSEYLKATRFTSFAIPGGAIIDGIVVEIEKSLTAGTGTLEDTTVQLVKRGVIVGQNRASQGAAWTGTDAYSTYGSSTDTWGVVWTPSDINASGIGFSFGVVFSCTETASLSATAGVDHVRITVYYTDGFISGAQVQDSSEIILYGQRYRLSPDDRGNAGKVNVTLATSFPPKMDIGSEFSRPSNPIVESYTVDDLRGGMGLVNYRTPADLNRYWYAENFDGTFLRAWTVGPQVTTTAAWPGGSARPAGIGWLASSNVVAVSTDTGPEIYNLSGDPPAWSALIDTLPADLEGEIIEFSQRLFHPLGSYGYSYQATAASVATDVPTGANDPRAICFAVWDDKIWALDIVGKLWQSTTGDAGSWTGLATVPPIVGIGGGDPPGFLQLVVYNDAGGDLTLWALTTRGAWIYDAVNDKWFATNFTYPHHYVATNGVGETERTLGIAHLDSIYLRYERDKLAKLTMGGGILQVDPFASPFEPDGPWIPHDGYFAAFTYQGFRLFVLVSAQGGAGVQSLARTIFMFDQRGWHPIATISTSDSEGANFFRVVTTSDGSKLYWHEISGTSKISYIDLTKFSGHPTLAGSTREYAASGTVELPIFNAWNSTQTKIAQQARIKLSGAGSSATVQLAYRINGSVGAYTNVGSAIATTDEVVIPLGTNNTGIAFKSWQWEVTFTAPGSSNIAPKVEYLALDYVRKEEVQRGFQVNLDLSTSYFGRSPQQMLDDIWVHMKAESWGTFAYKDDADDTRSYLVKVMRPGGEEGTGGDTTGRYSLFLIEMGPN